MVPCEINRENNIPNYTQRGQVVPRCAELQRVIGVLLFFYYQGHGHSRKVLCVHSGQFRRRRRHHALDNFDRKPGNFGRSMHDGHFAAPINRQHPLPFQCGGPAHNGGAGQPCVIRHLGRRHWPAVRFANVSRGHNQEIIRARSKVFRLEKCRVGHFHETDYQAGDDL